jgi:hypothetical protein
MSILSHVEKTKYWQSLNVISQIYMYIINGFPENTMIGFMMFAFCITWLRFEKMHPGLGIR